MFKKTLISVLTAGYILAPFVGGVAKADDTEVYFNDAGLITNTANPKVVIALEWSSNTNGADRLANLRTAFKAVASNDKFLGKVDLGVLIYYSTRNSTSAKTERAVLPVDAIDDDGENFAQFVDNELVAGSLSGGPALVKGYTEVARYFQGMTREFGDTPKHKGLGFDLSSEAISGAGYKNLLADANCGGNAVILISGGQPGNNRGTSEQIKEVTKGNCGACNSAADVAKYLKAKKVDTYTVFTGGKQVQLLQNLQNISTASETGDTFVWNGVDPNALSDFIAASIEKVLEQGSSFVQAGVTVSQQNRLQQDNHLYFSQFQPDSKERWPGNLKRYRVDTITVGDEKENILVDAKSNPAVNDKGFFRNGDPVEDGGYTAQSFWDADGVSDGNNVRFGGATEALSKLLKLGDPVTLNDGSTINPFINFDRTVYSNYKVTGGDNLKSFESDYTSTDFGFNSAQAWEDYVNQARGLLVSTQYNLDADGNILEPLDGYKVATVGSMGDPLHSVPKIVKYASGKEIAFFATNMGYLHAVEINSTSGKEAWAYIPDEFVTKLDDFYDDVVISKAEDHQYGLDGQISIVHQDKNLDTIVDSGEKVFMIVGMRRGGSIYHVLDISSLNSPKFLYKFEAKASGINPGQSWPEPQIGNIQIGDSIKTVMMLGGGYDKARDDAVNYKKVVVNGVTREVIDGIAYNDKPANTQGNGLFIIDINSGAVIWSTNKTSDGTAIKDSIAAEVTPFGFNQEGLIEHFYAADTGGNVYRVDIDNERSKESGGGVFAEAKHIADLNVDTGKADNRRIYYSPTAAVIEGAGITPFVGIAIGTGYRAHPLDETVSDYFYMIKDSSVLNNKEVVKLTHSDLVDVTPYVNATDAENSGIDFDAIKGWKIQLKRTGEKVLAEARIINNKIAFTSYVPTAKRINTCSVVIGSGSLYGVNVIDGTSFFDENTRSIDDVYPGIPPAYQLLFLEDGFVGLVGNNIIKGELGNPYQAGITSGLDKTKRMNWQKVDTNGK